MLPLKWRYRISLYVRYIMPVCKCHFYDKAYRYFPNNFNLEKQKILRIGVTEKEKKFRHAKYLSGSSLTLNLI